VTDLNHDLTDKGRGEVQAQASDNHLRQSFYHLARRRVYNDQQVDKAIECSPQAGVKGTAAPLRGAGIPPHWGGYPAWGQGIPTRPFPSGVGRGKTGAFNRPAG